MINIIAFKANSEDTNLSVFGGETPSDAVSIVPSTLMKTPSSDFALGYSAVFRPRAIACELSFTSSALTITDYKGNLVSNVGLHIVSFKKELSLGVGDFTDNDDSILYCTFKYNDNQADIMEYPLDDVSLVSQLATDAPPLNSVPVCKVTVTNGAITNAVSTVSPLDADATMRDLQNFMTASEIADIYLAKADASSLYLTQVDASNLYLTQADSSNTYLTTSDASSTYLTQADASSTYLTQADVSNTYLTQADASTTYLTQADASSTYLTQADVSTTYIATASINNTLTSTATNVPLSANMGRVLQDNINTKLTYNAGYVRDLTELSLPASYNRLSWVQANGATTTLPKLHQQHVDIRTYQYSSTVQSDCSVDLKTSRSIFRNATNVGTGLTDIRGTFIGSRLSSWFHLAMYIDLGGFALSDVRSAEDDDRWRFIIKLPLEALLREELGNNSILLTDPDNANALYQGSCNIQLTGFTRSDYTKVFVPDFVGTCWVSSGFLTVSCQGDVANNLTEITSVSGVGIKVNISGIGRI